MNTAAAQPKKTPPSQVALAEPSGIATLGSRSFVRAGDTWTYALLDRRNKVNTVTVSVMAVNGDRVEEQVSVASTRGFTARRTFKLGFDPEQPFQETGLPGGVLLVDFAPYALAGLPPVGTEFRTEGKHVTVIADGAQAATATQMRVVAREKVRVPAGEFDTVRVEARSADVWAQGGIRISLLLTYWYSEAQHRVVKASRRQFATNHTRSSDEVLELERMEPAAPGVSNLAAAQAATPDTGAAELSFWDNVKEGGAAHDYQAYLNAYPHGRFAELARGRLAALDLTAQAAASKTDAVPTLGPAQATTRKEAQPQRPTQVALAQPSSVASPAQPSIVRVGDSWIYEVRTGKRNADTLTITVTTVDGDRIHEKVTRGNARGFSATRTFKAAFDATEPFQELELPGGLLLIEFAPYSAPGGGPPLNQEWGLTAKLSAAGGRTFKATTRMDMRVVGEERIRVPAGEFNAVRVQARSGRLFMEQGNSNEVVCTWWYSKEMRRVVKFSRQEIYTENASRGTLDTFELASYRQGE
jgi:hypothetical protein